VPDGTDAFGWFSTRRLVAESRVYGAHHAASKYALSGFVEVLRQELRGSGVRISVIFPGRIDTPMIADVEVPRFSAKIPPEKVALAILRAVSKHRPEAIVPRAGKALILANALSPTVGDFWVRRLRLQGSQLEKTAKV
jgi:short-subunit dehydrogenase